MKKELRTELRGRLAALGAEQVRGRSVQAAELLFATPEYERAEILMAYLTLPLEADAIPIAIHAWQRGKRVLAPLVSWQSHQMIPIEINSMEDVSDGPAGVRQPRGEPIPVELIDLVIVPGLGFDSRGNRIGRGRGFYDRFLGRPSFRGIACGFALEEQVVDSVAAAAHDVPIHMLVTDRQVRRFAGPKERPEGRPGPTTPVA